MPKHPHPESGKIPSGERFHEEFEALCICCLCGKRHATIDAASRSLAWSPISRPGGPGTMVTSRALELGDEPLHGDYEAALTAASISVPMWACRSKMMSRRTQHLTQQAATASAATSVGASVAAIASSEPAAVAAAADVCLISYFPPAA